MRTVYCSPGTVEAAHPSAASNGEVEAFEVILGELVSNNAFDIGCVA